MTSDRMTVAVTGASGYIGSFIVAELLARGYGVHALVRGCRSNQAKAEHLRRLPAADKLLTLFDGGDLSVHGSFEAAFNGADAVVHTAAVVMFGSDASIVTASVDGTQNVLEAVDATPTITRFVHTSSVAAIQSYDKPASYRFDESDWNAWSSMANGDAYGLAKTEAELLVHRHFKNDGRRSAVTLNPGVVIGPVMTKAHTKATAVFLRDLIFNNKVMQFPATYVDVRDVATAHVNAMEGLPALHMKRFVLTNDTPCLRGGAVDLAKVAARVFPDARFDGVRPRHSALQASLARAISRVPVVGARVLTEAMRVSSVTPIEFDNSAARRPSTHGGLGIDFRPLESTVKDGVDSIVGLGFAKLTPRSRM